MRKKVQQNEGNELSVRSFPLAKPFLMPALVIPRSQTVAIELIAPRYQAERIEALRETEERVRKEKERVRRQQERRMQQQQAARQATFTVD